MTKTKMKTKRKHDIPIGGIQRYEIAARKYMFKSSDAHISRQSQNRYVLGGDLPSNAIRVWSTFNMAEACIKACFKGSHVRRV